MRTQQYFGNVPEVVGIIGSRNYQRPDKVVSFVNKLPPGTLVISGGARGVDQIAEKAARGRVDLPDPLIIPVTSQEWETYGKRVGHLRNAKIVSEVKAGGNPGLIVAFVSVDPDTGEITSGSRNCLKQAKSEGVPTRTFATPLYITTGPIVQI